MRDDIILFVRNSKRGIVKGYGYGTRNTQSE